MESNLREGPLFGKVFNLTVRYSARRAYFSVTFGSPGSSLEYGIPRAVPDIYFLKVVLDGPAHVYYAGFGEEGGISYFSRGNFPPFFSITP